MIRIVIFAVALLTAAAPAIAADELGRLFFDSKQRASLDEKRRLPKIKGNNASVLTDQGESPQPSSETESVILPEPRMTGKVTRSSGNNTVWMNDHPNYKRQTNR